MALVDPGEYFGAIQRVDWRLFAPAIAVSGRACWCCWRAWPGARSAPLRSSGVEGLLGRRGRVKVDVRAQAPPASRGSVFVDGARWEAVANTAIAEGEEIEVRRVLCAPTRLEVAPANRTQL